MLCGSSSNEQQLSNCSPPQPAAFFPPRSETLVGLQAKFNACLEFRSLYCRPLTYLWDRSGQNKTTTGINQNGSTDTTCETPMRCFLTGFCANRRFAPRRSFRAPFPHRRTNDPRRGSSRVRAHPPSVPHRWRRGLMGEVCKTVLVYDRRAETIGGLESRPMEIHVRENAGSMGDGPGVSRWCYVPYPFSTFGCKALIILYPQTANNREYFRAQTISV